MNSLYKLYFLLPQDRFLGIISKSINRIIGKVIKLYFDKTIPAYYLKTINEQDIGVNIREERKLKYIFSLTSFPARIGDVWICVESLLRQTFKPDMIILWLAEGQFPDKKIPKILEEQTKRGLTIRWCDEDLRSHKKYFYVLQEYMDADIVLLDDDLYYPDRLLENLVGMAKENPGCICATRVHKMTYARGKLNPYRQWYHNFNKQEDDSADLFFTSGAGTLIPAGVMPQDTFNKKVFKDICFFADDVWLNFQARKGGVKVITNDFYNKDEISVGRTQCVKLVQQNVLVGGNDMQIRAVKDYLKLK